MPMSGPDPAPRWVTLTAVCLLLLGLDLRSGLFFFAPRFHADEALFATYARSIALHDDWLLLGVPVPLDKPPLGLILPALSFKLFGVSLWSARLSTYLFIAPLQLAVMFTLTRRIYGWRLGLIALLWLIVSPLDISFAASIFHDPLLVLWLGLASLAVAYRRWGWAGLCVGLALATKQSAVQWLPLWLAMGYLGMSTTVLRYSWRTLRTFAAGCIVGIGGLILWNAARHSAVDFWAQGFTNTIQLRWIRPDEVWPRLHSWLTLLGYGVGYIPLLGLAWLPMLRPAKRLKGIDAFLAVALLATLLAYWLLAFPTYDRYIYPLLLPLIWLCVRGLQSLSARQWQWLAIGLGVVILPMSWMAAQGQLPTGAGDHGEFMGIEQLATRLVQLPTDAEVHEYWLTWELLYYLGDQPPVPLRFQPSPQSLQRYVCATPAREHYLTMAAWRLPRWIATLQQEGMAIQLIQAGNFPLYHIACRF